MAQPTLKSFANNLVVKKTDYRFNGINVDAAHLLDLFGDDIRTSHLGTLSVFNQWQWVNTPLMKMTELMGNTLYLNGDDGELSFNMLYQLEGVTVKEDLTSDTPKVGIDGQPFEILLGDGAAEPAFQVNQRIIADYYDGQELIVLEVGERLGEGFKYKVRLVSWDAKHEYVQKKFLATGVQYYSLGSAIGKYDEEAGSIGSKFGVMKLKHQLGSKRAVKFEIHGSAQRLRIDNLTGLNDLNSFNVAFESMLSGINSTKPDFQYYFKANDKLKSFGVKDSFLPAFEKLIMAQLMKDEENDLMWGKGGVVTGARGVAKIINQGLYEQMKLGNWDKIPRYSKQRLIAAFNHVYRNRPDIPDTERYFNLQGGRGACNEFAVLFAEELNRTANQFGGMLNTDQLKVVTGDPMNLKVGFRVGTVFISGTGWITITHNPAFDSVNSRITDEPYYGGLGKKSYTSCIFDLTDQKSTNAAKVTSDVEFAKGFNNGANLYMVRNSGLPGIKRTVVNGRTSPYPVVQGGHNVASSLFDGAKFFYESQSMVFLADPTRSLLLELE